MLPYLLTLLLVLLSAAVVAAVIVALDVAFRGPRVLDEREVIARFWQPPFARGKELFEWARQKGAKIVGRWLQSEPSTVTPTKLAAELHKGALQAMLPLLSDCDRARTMPCPRDGQGMIGITPPEAIALADYIRRNLSRKEAKRIHTLAMEIARDVSELRHSRGDEMPCALLGCEHVCRTYPVRPLQCRPFCMHA